MKLQAAIKYIDASPPEVRTGRSHDILLPLDDHFFLIMGIQYTYKYMRSVQEWIELCADMN